MNKSNTQTRFFLEFRFLPASLGNSVAATTISFLRYSLLNLAYEIENCRTLGGFFELSTEEMAVMDILFSRLWALSVLKGYCKRRDQSFWSQRFLF